MKLADVAIRRPVFAVMMIAVLVVFGVIGYSRLGVDLFPNVEFPVVTIVAVYPGADPEAVETKVVTKIEDAVAGIAGIKALRSSSLENVGQVVIQFVLEKDVKEAAQEVRDKVSGIQRELPKEVEPPQVERFDMGAAPVLSPVLAGRLPVRELTELADDVVKAKLQEIQGVGGVDLVGGRDREIQVWVSGRELSKYHLAVGDVFATLAAQNLELPGGSFRRGQDELVLKFKGEVRSAEEIKRLVIPLPLGGAPIRLGDVARVMDTTEEPKSYSSLDGTAAVSLVVRKKSGSNVTEVAQAVKKRLADLRPLLDQKGVAATVAADSSSFIETSVHDVVFDLVFGAFLAVAIILLFLRNPRTTVISAVAIPTSVVATMAFIYWLGFSLNWMTLLALSLSIGILIDDAIVVIENIYRNMEGGMERMEAARFGTAEIGLAVMATTFSIVAVFVPVAFMKGMIGRFFYQFGVTVSVAVIISLFVSFTLTPMLSSRFVRVSHRQNALFRAIERILVGLDGGYRRILGWALGHRALVLLLAFGVFVATVYLGRFLKLEFVPPMDRSEFNVTLELPSGKSMPTTQRYAEAVAAKIRQLPGVVSTFVRVGGGVQQKTNEAEIYVKMVKRAKRAFSQSQLMDRVRGMLKGQRGVTTAVAEVSEVSVSGMRTQKIQYNIRGPNLEQMAQISERMLAEMRKTKGLVDVDSSYRGGKPEISVIPDRAKAAELGVPMASIAMTVRQLMGNDKASQLRDGGELIDVRVRLQAADRITPADLSSLEVRSSKGQLVAIGNLAAINEGRGPTLIERQARQRQITLLANLQGMALGEGIAKVRAIAKQHVPATFTSSFAGMGEVMEESFSDLKVAMLLAIIMVYMILASQFDSFLHPVTIMFSLPLSLIGAIGGLLLTRSDLSIFAMIGIIMLMGLVTKNAILLVDYTQTLRSRGRSRAEALLEAGPVRLRPILMTTAAMVFGMIPVAIGMGEGSEARSPMAICVIGGLLTSTLLTLVVVPVVYTLIDTVETRVKRLIFGPPPASPSAGDGVHTT